jgi:hypothetical protein
MGSLPETVRRRIRQSVRGHHSWPIKVVDGNSPPAINGKPHQSYRHKTVVKSTRRIEVGADWICAQPEMAALILEYELREDIDD